MKSVKSLVRALQSARPPEKDRPGKDGPQKGKVAKRPALLVFHIGDHKTGSTSIQYAFTQKQVRIGKRAVLYPTKLNHTYLRQQIETYGSGKPKARAEAAEVFEKLATRIRSSGAPAALISAEAFEKSDPAQFHDVVRTYFAEAADEIRVIAYVRPHAARFLSNYAEQIKIGSSFAGLDRYARRVDNAGRLAYHPRFAAWQQQFGDAFILRPMIREELAGGDILADFVAHAFPGASLGAEGGPANESLSLEDLLRLRVLQSRLRDKPQKLRHAIGWEFSRLVGTLPPPATRTRITLHRSLAEQLQATYAEDAAALDASFFSERPLMAGELARAVENATPEAQELDPAAYFSPAEMRSLDLFADLAAGMLEADEVNWIKTLRSRRIAALQEEDEE